MGVARLFAIGGVWAIAVGACGGELAPTPPLVALQSGIECLPPPR